MTLQTIDAWFQWISANKMEIVSVIGMIGTALGTAAGFIAMKIRAGWNARNEVIEHLAGAVAEVNANDVRQAIKIRKPEMTPEAVQILDSAAAVANQESETRLETQQ